MSLLLDAMKKSGDNAQSTGLSNMSLEEHPNAAQNTSTTPEAAKAIASRAAGETLFAAKKKKVAPKWRWNLGLVPTTFLICSVLGAGYGYYVWRELNPPAPQVAERPAAPPPAPISTPVAPPLPPLVASIAPTPAAQAPTPPPMELAPPTAPKAFTQPARPRAKGVAKPRTTTTRGAGMSVERNTVVDSITPALQEAYQAYQQGDYDAATRGYRDVLNKDARNRDALLGLGAIAQQKGQDEAAQYYYRQILLLDPRDSVALAAMSAYGTSAGENNESRLKQLISEQPRSGALHYALGNAYAEQSRWGDAQQEFFNAHMLEPSNAQFAYNLAVSLDHLGQSKIAAQYYQQALQLDAANNAGFDHAQALQRLNELNAPSR